MSKTPDYRPSQEDLLGYLLGALDEAEQEQVARYIAGHPEIQGELGKLERCLLPLRCVDAPVEPPGGLARRTCLQVFAHGDRWVEPRREFAGGDLSSGNWQIWDLTMLTAAISLLVMLVMPAVYHSRESARRLGCASNLRTLSVGMRSYSELHGGRLPSLPISGPASVAGSYALLLKQAQMLPYDHVVICPATQSNSFNRPFFIPSESELAAMDGEALLNAQRQLGGTYGYHIGELINGLLRGAIDDGREHFAILSDAPEHARGLGLVACHERNGRNVLCESGRVFYHLPIEALPCGMDDMFHNRSCRLAPGSDSEDQVIAESGVQLEPLLMFVSEVK
jgi:hypothetical protein